MQIIHKVLLRIGSGEWNKSLQDDTTLPYGANPDQAKMRGCLTTYLQHMAIISRFVTSSENSRICVLWMFPMLSTAMDVALLHYSYTSRPALAC